ncbi:MFS transporter [Jannaschia sp. W003]|uniref:MFS transporter n=1 Tax=Jannaschia sp. W003 TaxID=2867012 RepID=UPI0021A44CEC|nr:MFS transporter [Jannaschia sp. W003]UWQ20089.1 MFS transporter [Jannaschia sp. W003]
MSAPAMPGGAPSHRGHWRLALACALILALAMGAMVNGLTAFVVPLEAAHGWSRGEIALINTLGILGLALGGLPMGALADRIGTRPVVLGGAIVVGTCYLLAALAIALWQFYGFMFVAGFFGAAAIFPPVIAYVGRWFAAGGAGLAIGVVSAGQALGQGGVPFASSLAIERIGTAATFAATGVLMLVLLVPLALTLRPPPPSGASNATARAGYPPFHVVVPALCLAIVLCCTTMSVPLMHLVPLVQDRGHAAEEAGGVVFAMLLVAILGRVAFGKLADVIGALPAYMTATAWMAALVYGFVLLEDAGAFLGYAIIYGFGYAGVMTGVLVSIGALTAPERRGMAIGVVTMFGWFGHANGGFLGGALFDATGGHEVAFGIAAATGLANLLVVGTLLLWVRRDRTGRDELYRAHLIGPTH